MIIDKDGCSFVVVGGWNPAIFTPAWIIGRLTEAREIAIEFQRSNIAAPPRLTFDNIYLRVMQERLVINLKSGSDEEYATCQRILRRLFADLPHTPVSAVGVNVRFLGSMSNPNDATVANCLTINDTSLFASAGAAIRSAIVKRSIAFDDLAANVTVESRGESVWVDFNFHYDAASISAAVNVIDGDILRFKNAAKGLLTKTFPGLVVEG